MQSLAVKKRLNFELVKALDFSARAIDKRFWGDQKWEVTLVTENRQTLRAKITDPVFFQKLELNYRPKNICLVTVSLGMPWRPNDWS